MHIPGGLTARPRPYQQTHRRLIQGPWNRTISSKYSVNLVHAAAVHAAVHLLVGCVGLASDLLAGPMPDWVVGVLGNLDDPPDWWADNFFV